MKKYIIFTFIFLMGGLNMAFAQKRSGGGKIEALKKAYITDKLNLTEAEANAFWPVYDEHEKRIKAIKENFRTTYSPRKFKEMSDQEIETALYAKIDMEQTILDERKVFLTALRGKLPIKKIARLERVHKSFKREMLRKMRKHRGKNKDERRKKRFEEGGQN